MKQLAVVWVLVASATARADQCQIVDADVADYALKALPKGASFVEQCEPCGEAAPSKPRVVNTVRVDKKAGSIMLNGKVADLAYVFVQTGKWTYTNVALMTGCPTTGVAASVSVKPASKQLSGNLPRECVRYSDLVQKLEACPSLPKEAKDALRQGFEAMSQAWSGNLPPEQMKAMADGCKAGSDALEQAAKSLNCPI